MQGIIKGFLAFVLGCVIASSSQAAMQDAPSLKGKMACCITAIITSDTIDFIDEIMEKMIHPVGELT